MIRLQDDALVLRRTPFRETSLILHFFTRHHGVLSSRARGIRTARRRASQLNQAALAGFHTLSIGHQGRSIENLGTLTAAEIRRPRQHVLFSAPALLAAQVSQETIYRFMPPLQPQPPVFELLEWAWNMLDAGEDPLAVAAICQGRLVRALGYGWRTDCCAGCGISSAIPPELYFSSKRGQVVCHICAAPYRRYLFPVSAALFPILQQLQWTEQYAQLSKDEKATLYQISMHCLARLPGQAQSLKMLSDQPFRQRVGLQEDCVPLR